MHISEYTNELKEKGWINIGGEKDVMRERSKKLYM